MAQAPIQMPDYMGAAKVKMAQRAQAVGEMDRIIQQYKLDAENERKIAGGALATLGAAMEHDPDGVKSLAESNPEFGKALKLLNEGKAKKKDMQIISASLAADTQARSQKLEFRTLQAEALLNEQKLTSANNQKNINSDLLKRVQEYKVQKEQSQKAAARAPSAFGKEPLFEWDSGPSFTPDNSMEALIPYMPLLERGAMTPADITGTIVDYNRESRLREDSDRRLTVEERRAKAEEDRVKQATERINMERDRLIATEQLNEEQIKFVQAQTEQIKQKLLQDKKEHEAELRSILGDDFIEIESTVLDDAAFQPIDITEAAGASLMHRGSDLVNSLASYFGETPVRKRAKAKNQILALASNVRRIMSRELGTHGGAYEQSSLDNIIPSRFDTPFEMRRKMENLVSTLKTRLTALNAYAMDGKYSAAERQKARTMLALAPKLITQLELSLGAPLTRFDNDAEDSPPPSSDEFGVPLSPRPLPQP